MQAQEIRPDETFDLIVVGAGLGGSILSSRIAQFGVNPRNGEKLKIALFEQGPYLLKGDPVRGYGTPDRRAKLDNINGEVARIGELVGGAMTHAGLISYPPMPIDFVQYREATGVDWTWEKFNLAIAEMWEMWHPYPEPDAIRTPGQQRFREAALKMGLDVHEAGIAKLNCPRCGCCNGHICKYDAKSSPLVTYIPIAEREGVRIIPEALVQKVAIEKQGSRPVATGVIYKYHGELRRALAGKTILCCSMEGTPRLLYQSGYGPREKVQGELVAENRNVGANRSGSLAAPHIEAYFGEPIKHSDISVHCVYYTVKSLGPGGYNQLMIRENLGCREGSYTFPTDLALARLAPEFGREHKQFMKDSLTHWGFLSPEVCKNQVRPKLGEEVLLTRASLEKNQPRIMEGLREGQEMAYKILKDMGAKKIVGHESLPERFNLGFATSTCRAGASAENSVVNSDFECHDIDNLYVCDRSVPPCQATANVSMPIAAITNYAWRRMVAKHFSRV